MGWKRVRYNWANFTFTFHFSYLQVVRLSTLHYLSEIQLSSYNTEGYRLATPDGYCGFMNMIKASTLTQAINKQQSWSLFFYQLCLWQWFATWLYQDLLLQGICCQCSLGISEAFAFLILKKDSPNHFVSLFKSESSDELFLPFLSKKKSSLRLKQR